MMRFDFAQRLKGSGRHSISVPAMDGALKPNDELDAASVAYRGTAPDNLVHVAGAAYFSDGRRILRLDQEDSSSVNTVAMFRSDITCLAAIGDQFAVGLDVGELRISGGRFDGFMIDRVGDRPTNCLTAACFVDEQTMLLALGSRDHVASEWKRDLMEGRASGSVWRVDLSSGQSQLLADSMAYPYGLHIGNDVILVSESWRHRIVDLASGRPKVVVDDLPFYPARMAATSAGDVMVCGFAPRRQLVEFVLREPEFLRRMMADVPQEYWMAPAMRSGADHWEPLQSGQIRQHGTLKPWAPSRSYGLVATMDLSGRFKQSVHCRAGGVRHGTTSAIECGTKMVVTAKGGGMVLMADTEHA